MQRILLTGANGYIGRRLKHALITKDDIQLRLMVRNAASLSSSIQEHTEIVTADVLNPDTLDNALRGIDVAYYLIHPKLCNRNDYV